MDTRLLMRTAVAAGLLLGAWSLRPSEAAAADGSAKPNIVVIMADDQDDVDSLSEMPELTKLAARGVVFTNSFVNYSLCCPSRASFLTGQAAHNSGVLGNKLPDGGWQKLLPTEGNTLGVWLQAAGYRTAIMGKLMNGYGEGGPEEHTHVMPGWDEFDVLSTRVNSGGDDGDSVGYRYYHYTLNENGVLKTYGKAAYDYQTDVLATKGEAFIRSSSGPFFLLMQPIAPHGTHGDDDDQGDAKGFPEAAPRYDGALETLKFKHAPNFNEKNIKDKPAAFQAQVPEFKDPGEVLASQRRRREAMLAVDDMVKRVVDTLTETGQLDNTYIVVTSDNGYSEGAHRWQGKIVLYEESIHVPLVIAGPGVARGQRREQLVNNLDVTASILKWAGAKPGRTLDGVPLTPVLKSADAPWRSAILVENKHEQAVRTSDWIYAEGETAYGDEKELYSLKQDPYELKNGSDGKSFRSRQAMARLSPILQQLRTCAGASCWVEDKSADDLSGE